jgi:hypothetical protein
MRRLVLPSAFVLTFIARLALPVGAQTLARRVEQAGSAPVRILFAAQPDVCGDGENIMRVREGNRSRIDFIRGRNGMRGMRRENDEAWLGRCRFGPLAVTLHLQDGRVTDADLRVGDEPGEGVTELGRVRAAEAVDYLLRDVVPRSDREAANEILLAAVLADSVETWPALLEIGQNDRIASGVRRTAVFWVGQAAASKATEGLVSIAGDESEVIELRKHALFALSQRPRDEGVPALIDVAKSSREPELLKSALFWLGQTNDPRALDLFREILARR